jgi:hypothetical protein
VARLDLTPGAECVFLEAKNEKNCAGSTVPLRADLAADLRRWIAEKKLAASDRLFTVPAGLRLILDRDMRAASIPKRDDRGRTIDVHAMRTTFGTMLSTSGTAPRTAPSAMRHSDIKLTMNTYTDPKLLAVREAVERLPSFGLSVVEPRAGSESAHDCAGTSDPDGQLLASTGTTGAELDRASDGPGSVENSWKRQRKTPADLSRQRGSSSRADRIRTCDLLVPKPVVRLDTRC